MAHHLQPCGPVLLGLLMEVGLLTETSSRRPLEQSQRHHRCREVQNRTLARVVERSVRHGDRWRLRVPGLRRDPAYRHLPSVMGHSA